eukprot:GHVO01039732.1.p2 GENE.GHVO01039732.1~~GHVO01039732.1.p2  ORF type:complete len:134 (+),score=19.85 GHVO01039732.1:98-499(+)
MGESSTGPDRLPPTGEGRSLGVPPTDEWISLTSLELWRYRPPSCEGVRLCRPPDERRPWPSGVAISTMMILSLILQLTRLITHQRHNNDITEAVKNVVAAPCFLLDFGKPSILGKSFRRVTPSTIKKIADEAK